MSVSVYVLVVFVRVYVREASLHYHIFARQGRYQWVYDVNGIALTSVRRNHVASTIVRRYFDVNCYRPS